MQLKLGMSIFFKKSKVTASKPFETVLCWLTMGRLGKEKKIGLS